MLLTTVLVLAAATAGDAPAGIQKHPGPMEKALQAAKEGARPVLLDFFTGW